MNKKIMPIVIPVLLFFAGIIALTQEMDFFLPGIDEEEPQDFPVYVPQPVRWFRSNAGGMALEEIHSRLVALRGEYALAIASVHPNELPEYLFPYYDNKYLIETRRLYKNGEQSRLQWLFRDTEGSTRMNAVLVEPEISDDEEQPEKHIAGFIEIFDEKFFLTSEYRFFENGKINRIDYGFNDNLLINAIVFTGGGGEDYINTHTDFYRYNHSLSLRFIERIFYEDMEIQQDAFVIIFPRYIMDIANEQFTVSERLNIYPDFFGNIFVYADSRIVYDTDSRGRILTQTLYNEEDEIVWVIRNTWQDNRIVSTSRIEGAAVLLAEFEYNSDGDRILERNFRNGVLERTVREEGEFDIEELYFNNVVVLRTVWENGVRISETRVRN